MPCTHIELISRYLTQSGLDCTLPLHAMHTHRIHFQQFDTIRSRFGPHPPPNAVHTHTIDFQTFDEIRIGLYPSHRLDCQPFDTIRFGSYPPPHTMYTHKIDFQSFDKSRQVWNIILPPHAVHTYGIDFQPFDKIRFASYPPPQAMHAHNIDLQHLTKSGLDSTLPFVPCTHICLIFSHLTKSGLDHTLTNISCTHLRLIASHLTKSGLDSTLPHVLSTHFTHFQPFAGSLVSALKGFSLRWYSGFPLPIIPISNIIPSVKFFYIPFLTETVPLFFLSFNFISIHNLPYPKTKEKQKLPEVKN